MVEGDTLCVAYPSAKGPTVVVKLSGLRAHVLKPPGPVGLADHSLATKGLRAGSAYEVKESAWAAALGADASGIRHLVVAFSDRSLDALCRSVAFRQLEAETETQDALARSFSDRSLKWWFVQEKKRKGSRVDGDSWIAEGLTPGAKDARVFPDAPPSLFGSFLDWVAGRQMRRAFGRRRTDL